MLRLIESDKGALWDSIVRSFPNWDVYYLCGYARSLEAHEKGRAFLIAVDTALKPLIAAGILPDLFVTVDGNKPVELFEQEEIWKIPVLLSADVNSEMVRKHTGKKIFYYNGEEFIQNLYLAHGIPCSGLPSGGSVSNSAFSLAERGSFSVWLRPARRGIVFPLAQRGPQPSRWRPCGLTDGA